MNRNIASFKIDDFKIFKQQMLRWANQFNVCCFLDNNQYQLKHHSVECMLGVNVVSQFLVSNNANTLNELAKFTNNINDWLLGHISYDFKENLYPSITATKIDKIGFPDIYFFQPETLIECSNKTVTISSFQNPSEVFKSILEQKTPSIKHHSVAISPRIQKQDYIAIINQLKQHIRRGDCYEINFCQEFFNDNATINPVEVYEQLVAISPNPFASFYKLHDKYLMCASPERFLKKESQTIFSQPIKGTHKRNTNNLAIDNNFKEQLYNSTKDRSENVMIVDLVRNDLSKICKEGSVVMEELYGIYSFPQVHQMISTIKGALKDDIDFAEVLEATFPMGSMTGAPKKRVIELTEQYEQSKRGIYSGCIGYIRPNKDFDFNVVIRSIVYNSASQYLSYHVGGGITFNSDAENEYEECLLKAEAIKKVLS